MGYQTSPSRLVSKSLVPLCRCWPSGPVRSSSESLVLVSGKLTQLKELLLSYNRIQLVPEELCCCQSLERLELAMNRSLDQLPNQVNP